MALPSKVGPASCPSGGGGCISGGRAEPPRLVLPCCAAGLAVPYLSGASIPYAVAAIGAMLMPHNLYLHSDLVLSR